MPKKKQNPIDSKSIREALEAGYDLYWQRRYRTYELRAVTYSFENGTDRTRKLFETENDEEARYLDEELKKAGAKIHPRSLHKAIYEI